MKSKDGAGCGDRKTIIELRDQKSPKILIYFSCFSSICGNSIEHENLGWRFKIFLFISHILSSNNDNSSGIICKFIYCLFIGFSVI